MRKIILLSLLLTLTGCKAGYITGPFQLFDKDYRSRVCRLIEINNDLKNGLKNYSSHPNHQYYFPDGYTDESRNPHGNRRSFRYEFPELYREIIEPSKK